MSRLSIFHPMLIYVIFHLIFNLGDFSNIVLNKFSRLVYFVFKQSTEN